MTRETGIRLGDYGAVGEVRAHFEPDRVVILAWFACGKDRGPRVLLTFPRDGLDALVTEALKRGGQ